MTLRPITETDYADVLALNERNVELLAPLDEPKLGAMSAIADRASVITHEDAFAGFVITFRGGVDYDSPNYEWFTGQYGDAPEAFYYLDRVVLDLDFRRLGLGTTVYDLLEERAAGLAPRLALEVNSEPPNTPSLAFHFARGYRQVGEQGVDGHRVALLVKDLLG